MFPLLVLLLNLNVLSSHFLNLVHYSCEENCGKWEVYVYFYTSVCDRDELQSLIYCGRN